MILTQKEVSLLKDMKTQEELCIEKYGKYACYACDSELKNLFTELMNTEKKHLNTLTNMLGKDAGGESKFSSFACDNPSESTSCPAGIDAQKYDAFLCQDMLAMEKHVSGAYDTTIFEFSDPQNRQTLNEIQKEEQQHGEKLYSYMSKHSMY